MPLARRLSDSCEDRTPIAVGRFEVSFAEWDRCVAAGACASANDAGWGRGDQPVIRILWSDAKAYVSWLSRHTRRIYRLPSESEWE